MRVFGWFVTLACGTYATYVLIKSLPDLVRYAKLRSK